MNRGEDPIGQQGAGAAKPARLVRLNTVMEWTGMSRSWIYRESACGRFVSRTKVGSATCFDADAVQAWIRAKIDAGQAGAAR